MFYLNLLNKNKNIYLNYYYFSNKNYSIIKLN